MTEPLQDNGARFHFSDFTVQHYRELLALARGIYTFEPFGTAAAHPHVLWRHDIDLSVHRAVRLAELEVEAGVRATYFVLLHSSLYNALERAVTTRLLRIARMGHWMGLHFDPHFYDGIETVEALEEKMELERHLLSQVLEAPVESMSFHNPDPPVACLLERDRLAGMLNVYGPAVRNHYSYCSDSNGYWRHHRLHDVLSGQSPPRLHVLTHPGWWQESPLSPADRVTRCVEGRAREMLREYEEQLRGFGRLNVGARSGG